MLQLLQMLQHLQMLQLLQMLQQLQILQLLQMLQQLQMLQPQLNVGSISMSLYVTKSSIFVNKIHIYISIYSQNTWVI
jgi:hypothetical protein